MMAEVVNRDDLIRHAAEQPSSAYVLIMALVYVGDQIADAADHISDVVKVLKGGDDA